MAKARVAGWLRQGMSPRRLALTLALGFAIGCFPILGLPTALCAVLAIALRLNLPAIQAANYAAMPLQILLIVPFLRLGAWLFSRNPLPFNPAQLGAMLHASPWAAVGQMSGWMGNALLAWLITAGPAVALLTVLLSALLRRIPALTELNPTSCGGD